MTINLRCFRFIPVIISGVFCTVAGADPGQFYLAPGVQWMSFHNEPALANERGFTAGLGFELAERWSVELGTYDLDPDREDGSGDIDMDHFRLDLLYDLDEGTSGWQPFVSAGIGNTEFGDYNDTLGALGAGLKLRLSDNLQWRTLVRSHHFLGRSFDEIDLAVESGLVWSFGTPRRTEPEPEPEPMRREAAPQTPPDSDNDGVVDARDDCPETPMNYAVDDRGCPIPVEEVARIELDVTFELDRDEVREQFFDEIQEVTDFMQQYPDVVAELEGHTDDRGAEQYNQDLSERRAESVRQVMIDRFGINGSRITTRGYGELQPVASNETSEGRARNRRVITIIMKTLQNYQPR